MQVALISVGRRGHHDHHDSGTRLDPDLSAVQVAWDDADRWLVVHRGALRVLVNLADQPREIDLDRPAGEVLFATAELPQVDGATVTLPAESAAVVSTR